MMEGDFSTAFARVRELAEDFQAGEQHFLQSSYSEAQARKDFIDKFWTALGWEIDRLVYDLYDLAPDEIEIVEGKAGN